MEKKEWRELVGLGKSFHISQHLRNRSEPIAPHNHDFAEIFWIPGVEESRLANGYSRVGQSREAVHGCEITVPKGKVNSRYRVRHWINGESELLESGDLVMILPSDCHGYHCIGNEPLNLVNVAFPFEVVDRFAKRYFKEDEYWFRREGSKPGKIRLENHSLQLLQREYELLTHAPRTEFFIDAFLLNLMRSIRPLTDEAWDGDMPHWLRNAMVQFMERSTPESSLSLKWFFSLCGRSPEHVARTTRKYLKCSPSHWVNQQRVLYASRLLEATNLTVLEIAYESGFETQAYFHRLFLKQTGRTPLKYRMIHRRVF